MGGPPFALRAHRLVEKIGDLDPDCRGDLLDPQPTWHRNNHLSSARLMLSEFCPSSSAGQRHTQAAPLFFTLLKRSRKSIGVIPQE